MVAVDVIGCFVVVFIVFDGFGVEVVVVGRFVVVVVVVVGLSLIHI